MKKLVLILTAVVAASMMTACGDAGANTAAKPANASTGNANSMAAAPADPKAAEAEVRKVMEAIKAGLSTNNADAMDKVYADNYTFVGNDGTMMTKAERLAALRSGEIKYTSFDYTEDKITVNPDGNSAVGIFKIKVTGTMKGKPMPGETLTTGTFVKAKDGWRLMSASNVTVQGGTKPDDKSKMAANANAQPAMSNKLAASNAKHDAAVTDDGEPPKKK